MQEVPFSLTPQQHAQTPSKARSSPSCLERIRAFFVWIRTLLYCLVSLMVEWRHGLYEAEYHKMTESMTQSAGTCWRYISLEYNFEAIGAEQTTTSHNNVPYHQTSTSSIHIVAITSRAYEETGGGRRKGNKRWALFLPQQGFNEAYMTQ